MSDGGCLEGWGWELFIKVKSCFMFGSWKLVMVGGYDKGLVINYGEGGATKWENRGSETFCATPSRQGKTFRTPPLKEWKLYAPPLQYGYNFKLPRKIYPKTFCAPPSEWLKLFPPPLFVGVKLHVPPPPVL